MGGGGFVAGPAGLRRGLPAGAAGADRGRQPPRARQPAARPARPAGLPRLPDRGPRGGALSGHRPPGAARGARGRPRRRPRRFGIDPGARCLLVMGGSQGARSINRRRATPSPTRDGRAGFHVLHLAGRRDHAELRERLGAAPPERYTLLEYEPDLGDCLAACDLVLGRSGGSIFEVAAAGRPAILVPYPHATADHQAANAAWMAEAGRRHRDPGRGARRAERAARARSRGLLADDGAPGADGRSLARAWPSPMPRRGSPPRCWRRRTARKGKPERLGGTPAPLHRDRRRRDERPGAGLRPARRRGQRQRPRRILATCGGCATPGSSRRSATKPPTCPTGPRSSSRPRSTRTTRSWRWRASAASAVLHRGELLAGALRGEAPDRGRGHPRQDDDDGDGRLGAAGARRRPRLLPRRRAAGCRPRRRRRQRGLGGGRVGRRRGRRERRQLPAAASPRSRSSPTSRWTTTRAGARSPSCAPPSPGSPRAPRASPSPRTARLDALAAGRRPAVARFDEAAPGPAGARARGPRPPQPARCARRRSPRLELAGADLEAAAAALERFPGVRRRLELKGTRAGARIYDDYAHHPTEVRGGARGAARARAEAARGRLPAPPLLADQGPRRRVRRGARRSPTRSASSTSIRLARSRSASSPGSAACRWPRRRPTAPAAGRSGGCLTRSEAALGLRRRGSARGRSW